MGSYNHPGRGQRADRLTDADSVLEEFCQRFHIVSNRATGIWLVQLKLSSLNSNKKFPEMTIFQDPLHCNITAALGQSLILELQHPYHFPWLYERNVGDLYSNN